MVHRELNVPNFKVPNYLDESVMLFPAVVLIAQSSRHTLMVITNSGSEFSEV